MIKNMPSIKELPEYINTKGWEWKPYSPSYGIASYKEFWLGTDLDGNKWLTKLRGSFYAYREIVYAKIAQSMNLSCQSSTYIELDYKSAELMGAKANEIHSVHWFIEEHSREPCAEQCPHHQLNSTSIFEIKDLSKINIKYILDWPSNDFLAYILGANEISDYIFTKDHEFIMIDSEQMFSTGPHSFDTLNWYLDRDKNPSLDGKRFAEEVCLKFSSLSIAE